MIINNHSDVAHMTTHSLRKCHFNFNQPCSILLEDGTVLQLEKILRIMPQKRIVALADYKNETVIAKIFFHKKKAAVHAEREQLGASNLLKMKIPTPPLLANLVNQEKTTHILLFTYLNDADNLDALWRGNHSLDIIVPTLKQVTQELATQHVLGVIQRDLHFKNFMVTPHKVFTIDSDQIEMLPQKLDKITSMKHLALFLSQLGIGFESLQKELFLFYLNLRGWSLKQHDLHDLFFYIRETNRLRWTNHQHKIFRESSQFSLIKESGYEGIIDRMAPENTLDLFKNPEQFFQMKQQVMLKNGRSSTVIRVTTDDYDWVIKRYNIKHFLHRLKRLFSMSRAKKSWYHTQKLVLFGIDLPKPIAYIERKKFGIKAECYYISEYVEGESLASLIENDRSDESKQLPIKNTINLLKKLVSLEWTHGDLKATNVIIVDNKPLLIDFDGAKEHLTLTQFREKTNKDWRRFLKNFVNNSFLKSMIRKELF